MGFFREAHTFVIEGNNGPPPNVPQIMAQVNHIIQSVPSGLPPGSHFQGTVQAMDENTMRYLQAELSQKDALLQAMKERKARKAEAARIAAMQSQGVGYSGCYGAGDNGISGIQSVSPPQIPFGSAPPAIGPLQGANPMMFSNDTPQSVAFVPQQMNIPPQPAPYYPAKEPYNGSMNHNYFHDPQSVEYARGYYMPPSHVQPQHYPYLKSAEFAEPDEQAEADEQSSASSQSANNSNGRYTSTRTGSFARKS